MTHFLRNGCGSRLKIMSLLDHDKCAAALGEDLTRRRSYKEQYAARVPGGVTDTWGCWLVKDSEADQLTLLVPDSITGRHYYFVLPPGGV